MKKALVLALAFVFALGLGLTAFAGPLSGEWFTFVRFGIDVQTPGLSVFSSELTVDYSVGGWTFTSVSDFANGDLGTVDGFADQYFIASGVVGAFSAASFLNFDPTTPAFEKWLTGGKVSIAGVSFYGFFDLEDAGSGWLFGAEGSAGELSIRAETYFNLAGSLIDGSYTYDDVVGGFADYAVSSCYLNGIIIADDAFSLANENCAVVWSGFDAELSFPFACIDEVVVGISFDCATGFDYVKFQLNDIALGVDWLTIDDFDIKFTTQTKSVVVDIDIALGGVCVTPYWELIVEPNSTWQINGLELYALGFNYTWNGVTFTDITLLDTTKYFLTTGGAVLPIGYASLYCVSAYDEMFQISTAADSCCGGGLDFSVTNWFDIEGSATGIFGWMETDLSVSVGVGSGYTFGFGAKVKTTGISSFDLSFDVTW